MKKTLLAALLSISLTAYAGDTLDQTMAELVAARDAITNAIVQKGGTVTSGALTNVPNEILSIPSGGGGGGSNEVLKAIVERQSTPFDITASDLAGVTKIGNRAFYYWSGLRSIALPDSVTSIGPLAFSECYGLTSITIGNGVTSMGDSAFYGCYGLTSVTIGTGLTSIIDGAFQNCNRLTSVTIGSSVTSIGESAFESCSSLPSVTIPDSVTSIGSAAFYACSNLATIDFGTTRSTVPTLGNANAFGSLPANYQILVPSALLTTWKAANNWNNSAIVDHIVAHP